MKTQNENNKLDFKRRDIIQLNNSKLSKVNGGWTITTNLTTITNFSKDTLCTSDAVQQQ